MLNTPPSPNSLLKGKTPKKYFVILSYSALLLMRQGSFGKKTAQMEK